MKVLVGVVMEVMWMMKICGCNWLIGSFTGCLILLLFWYGTPQVYRS
jgi:hypothetical protein